MSILAGRHWVGGGPTGSGTVSDYGLAENGRVLRQLGVWAGPRFLWGIRVWLSDDSASRLFGSAAGVYEEFTFEAGERITLLRFWGDGFANHTGGIRFTTNLGREFLHTMTQAPLQTAWPIDVHSGICVGVFLRSGDPIYAMGLRFLNPIHGATMDNVRYPNLASQAAAIRPLSLRQFRDENHSNTESLNWSSSGSYTTVNSSSWSFTAGVAVHASVTVSAGIPAIAQVGATAGWEVSASGTHATSSEKSETIAWDRSGTLPPRHWLNFEVTTRRGDISLPFEANMTIIFRDARLSYTVSGIYDGVAYTRLDIITTTGSLDNSTFHAQIKDVLCTPETIYRAKPPAAKALPLVDEPSPEEEQINRNEDKHPPMISDAGVGQTTINEIYISD